MDNIQTGFDLLQFIGRIAQIIPGIPHLVCQILNLVFEIRHAFLNGRKMIAETGNPGQRVFRLCQQSRGTVGIISAKQRLHRILQALRKLFGILQQLSSAFQFLVLSGLQIRLFDLPDLIAKGFHPAQLFAFVHAHPVNFPAQPGNGSEFFPIILQKLPIVRKGIQKTQMVFFIKKGRRIVLTVNVDQLEPQLVQDGHRDQTSVHTAYILSIQKDIPLNNRLGIIFHAVFLKPGKLRHLGEHTTDRGLVGAGTNHIPIGTLAHDGRNRIDHDGFTGTGLTGKNIKARVKGNIRPLNDCNIFNMQKTQHAYSSLTDHTLDFSAECRGGIAVAHHNHNSIVPGQSAKNHIDLHGIQRGAGSTGKARQRMNDNNVFRIVNAGDTLPENGIQPVRQRRWRVFFGYTVAVSSQAGELLYDSQLLNIPGNGGLGAGKALFFQSLQKLLLGLHIGIGDDFHDFCLSFRLHSCSP